MKDFIDLFGVSGASYRFRLWPDGAGHLPIAGNYALAKLEAEGFVVLSVGQTNDLSQLRAEVSKSALRAATHVLTRLNVARSVRMAEHQDLLTHHRAAPVREPVPQG
jgi:hypothetical protein